MVIKNQISLTVFIYKTTLQPVSLCFNLYYFLFVIHIYLLMNAAIAIDKTCAMGPLRRPYAGGEHDELGLVHRVADQALLVEPVQRVPVKLLPGAPVLMTGQKEKRQHRVVDLVRVERHPRTVPVLFDLRRGLRRMRTFF